MTNTWLLVPRGTRHTTRPMLRAARSTVHAGVTTRAAQPQAAPGRSSGGKANIIPCKTISVYFKYPIVTLVIHGAL